MKIWILGSLLVSNVKRNWWLLYLFLSRGKHLFLKDLPFPHEILVPSYLLLEGLFDAPHFHSHYNLNFEHIHIVFHIYNPTKVFCLSPSSYSEVFLVVKFSMRWFLLFFFSRVAFPWRCGWRFFVRHLPSCIFHTPSTF